MPAIWPFPAEKSWPASGNFLLIIESPYRFTPIRYRVLDFVSVACFTSSLHQHKTGSLSGVQGDMFFMSSGLWCSPLGSWQVENSLARCPQGLLWETKETLDAFGTAHECEGKTFEDVLNKIVRFLNQ